jgi:3-dehydroquinate synthase
MTSTHGVVLAAGSNLGDRKAELAAAIDALEEFVEIEAISEVVESAPEGGAPQGDYLNLVLAGRTALAPDALLGRMLEIERARGRVRGEVRGESRTLDLDLILHGDRLLDRPELTLPHPRWATRSFVARPLLSILPGGEDPASGSALADRVPDDVLADPGLRSKGWIDHPASGSVLVRTGSGDRYPVIVRRGALDDLPGWLDRRLPGRAHLALIADDQVFGHHGERVRSLLEREGRAVSVHPFPHGESHKNREEWARLTDALLGEGVARDGAVVALGGGVTGDLAGFVAATYMRGIPVVQIPTSLVAMIDASVGGKTGVDVPAGKNLAGAFHPPAFVLADPDLTGTLPRRERAQGLVEALKHGAILDSAYFEALLADAGALLDGDPGATEGAVRRSVEIKAGVVSRDEREGGLRQVLNFGHTLGHALEADSHYRMPHGTAVARGMVLEARLGERLGVTEAGSAHRIAEGVRALEIDPDTPPVDGATLERLLGLMRRDKKVRGGEIRTVLLSEVGQASPEDGWSRAVPETTLRSLLQEETAAPRGERV